MSNSFSTELRNYFIEFLTNKFSKAVAENVVHLYNIGTSDRWSGATVFWQVDFQGCVRSGKIMQYDPQNGKRVKEPYAKVDWIHNYKKIEDFRLRQCLFGEHLLGDSNRKIAIVESEKTAVIASIFIPDYIWLATGGKAQLTGEKCSVLAGRNVEAFPDLNGYEVWEGKIEELGRICRSFSVNQYLKRVATPDEVREGLDLADYLLR